MINKIKKTEVNTKKLRIFMNFVGKTLVILNEGLKIYEDKEIKDNSWKRKDE